jgi:hypothetical protein
MEAAKDMEPAVDGEKDGVIERARRELGITDAERLEELWEVAEIIPWISAGIRRAQDARPSEPPLALQFLPEKDARDFWRGPGRGR